MFKKILLIVMIAFLFSCGTVKQTIKKKTSSGLDVESLTKYTKIIVKKFNLTTVFKKCKNNDLLIFITKTSEMAERVLKEKENITNRDVRDALYLFASKLREKNEIMFKIYILLETCFPLKDADNEIIELKYREYLYTIISIINVELKKAIKDKTI